MVASPDSTSPSQSAPRHHSAIPHAGPGTYVMTSFVGREREIEEIAGIVRTPGVRLVTLIGPAGVGKTRLADRVALTMASTDPDGVMRVSLASVLAADGVAEAIAQAIGIQTVTGESYESRVVSTLSTRQMLLVLDNLEHLLPVPFLGRLLAACPEVRILATSRELLRASGEYSYVVPPMATPTGAAGVTASMLEGIESVALLTERARQWNPAFAVTDDNAGAIAQLCIGLDGLPLAIELAAARLRVFSPQALCERLGDQLALLTGGSADGHAHQRTIRDTIRWSHDLLPAPERQALRQLAVFPGYITPRSAAAVWASDPGAGIDEYVALDVLTSLADKSLVQIAPATVDEPRFMLLQAVRHYAAEQLDAAEEGSAARARHAAWFLRRAVRQQPDLLGPDQAAVAASIDADLPNFRGAMDALLADGQVADYARLVCALWRYWRIRGMLNEGRARLEMAVGALRDGDVPAPLRAMVLFQLGWLEFEQGDLDASQAHAAASLDIAEACANGRALGDAYRLLSLLENRHDRNAEATRLMALSLQQYRTIAEPDNIAGALNNLAIIALDDGAWGEVIAYGTESRDIFLQLGNLYGASHSIDTTSIALYCLGRYDEALQLSCRSLEIDRDLGDSRGIAVSYDHVGKCARALGDLRGAWVAHEHALRYRRDVGDPRGLLVWLEAMAHWCAVVGYPSHTARIHGMLDMTRTSLILPLQLHERDDHADAARLAREALGDEAFRKAEAQGRWLGLDEVIGETVAVGRGWAEGEVERMDATSLAGAEFGLTPREREVAEMLRKRYSDKEIAEALFISPRTVARHVMNILDKLDVRSRRDVAAAFASPNPEPDEPVA